MEKIIKYLPNPREMSTQLKEEPVSISLRIKPATKLFYERLASSDKSLSINGLMNGVLASYAEYYTNPASMGAISERLCKHLYAVAEKISHMDDEDLLARVYNGPRFEIYDGGALPISYLDAVADLNALRRKDPEAGTLFATMGLDSTGPDGIEIVTERQHRFEFGCVGDLNGKHACYTADAMKLPNSDEGYYMFRDIEIIPKYWAITLVMADAYLKKVTELMPGCNVVMTRPLAQLLVDVINSVEKREDLPSHLAEAFTMFAERILDE